MGDKKIFEELRKSNSETEVDQIAKYLLEISELIIKDYQQNKLKLPKNSENKIRNVLIEEYLIKKKSDYGISYWFDSEVPENWNKKEEKYDGRVDIRVLLPGFPEYPKYYFIECKRIDGEKYLNNQYVEKGINRFIIQKYSSRYGENIMWGFVIQKIDITQNVNLIQDIQNKHSNEYLHGKFCFVDKKNTSQRYKRVYNIQSKKLKLWHIFSDFSDIVE